MLSRRDPAGESSAAAAIRRCRPADAAAVCRIYNHYVQETVVTFEETTVRPRIMATRIREVTERWPWLVSEQDGVVTGYAYAAPWKGRSAYRFSVESTIYLAPGAVGRGVGSKLYGALVEELRGLGVHAIVGGIALPNPASVALHEKLGFEPIGEFREIGWKLGRWVNVGYWQLVLPDEGRGSSPHERAHERGGRA